MTSKTFLSTHGVVRGFELDAVQRGNMPTDFKPMLSIGAGVYEIRINEQGAWRVI